MKYLKIFEAFESKGISSTLKFLKTKVSSHGVDNFLNALKLIMKRTDFPIDKVSDYDIKYLKASKALELRTDEVVTNQFGIWALKFWFSIEKGYLGFTGTSNQIIEYTGETSDHMSGKRAAENFRNEQLDYIRENISANGEIWPVTDYNKLKTGDVVIGIFDGDRISTRKIAKATIVHEPETGRYYAIQNVADGSTPDDHYIPRDVWEGWGPYSWWIYNPGDMGNDHCCLHHFRMSGSALKVIEAPNEIKVEPKEDPLSWNLPVTSQLNITSWSRDRWSMKKENDIKEADFALVLYFDKMINPESDAKHFEPVSMTKISRAKEKSGATALMADEDIKQANIKRYLDQIINKISIKPGEIKNLNSTIAKCLRGEYTIQHIFQNGIGEVRHIAQLYYEMMNYDRKEDIEWGANEINRRLKEYTQKYYSSMSSYNSIKKMSLESEFGSQFKKLWELGQKIYNWLKKQDIETIDDILIVYQKLKSIYDLIANGISSFSYTFNNCLNYVDRKNDRAEYYLNQEYRESEQKNDMQILDRAEKYINSILI